MQTSAQGVADLKLHEGDVLKAYRCPAGEWTIGLGLTAASGVIKPVAGMKITSAESTRLTMLALARNYEPRVAKAMPGAKQHEFDGGISFDWNTGAIHKASWVKAWASLNWLKVRSALAAWNKGGGRVLPGLTRRREAEYQTIRYGKYASQAKVMSKEPFLSANAARITLGLNETEIEAVRGGLFALGYDAGPVEGEVYADAVEDFQRAYDLTVDGIIGRATLSTLQRTIDARGQAKVAAPAVVVTAGANSTDLTHQIADLPYAFEAMLLAAVIYALWQAYRYRDVIAAKIQSSLPRLAAYLRSF